MRRLLVRSDGWLLLRLAAASYRYQKHTLGLNICLVSVQKRKLAEARHRVVAVGDFHAVGGETPFVDAAG